MQVRSVLKYTFLYLIAVLCFNAAQMSFAISQTDLVIARYKEPLDFLHYPIFQSFKKIYLYNKGPEINDPFLLNNNLIEIYNLPNVGCEGHTYLHHMITQRDNLAEMTFFIPASWKDNSGKKPAVIHLLRLLWRGCFGYSGHIDYDPIDKKFKNFSILEYQHTNSNNIHNSMQLSPCKERPFGVWYEKNLSDRTSYITTYHGILTVPKSMILSNDTVFYENLISYLDQDRIPEAGHYIERSWGAIFNQKGAPLNRTRLPEGVFNSMEANDLKGLGP